jgi:hypothetical protein
VAYPSVPALIEMVVVEQRSNFMNPASEPKLITLIRFRKPSGFSVSENLLVRTEYQNSLKASSPARGILPRPNFQCDTPHPILSLCMEVRSVDFYS